MGQRIEIGYEVYEEGELVATVPDKWRCICGNVDELEGFRDFDAKSKACNRCGRIIGAKGQVLGETAPARGLNK
jgi:hypothetical protein